MRPPRLTDAAYRPLFIRAAVILACALVSGLSYRPALTSGKVAYNVALSQVMLSVILLLLVAAIGTVPLPGPVPPWLQPLAESLAAALVVSSLPGGNVPFLVYLLVPLAVAGLTASLAATATCAAVAAIALVATSTLQSTPALSRDTVNQWVLILAAVAVVSAWARRVVSPPGQPRDVAYEDAYRLLSELHVLARQLSLGLDPQTLAAALVDEVCELCPGSGGSVLVRSAGGRFVPLVGDPVTQLGESVVLDAWLIGGVVRRTTAEGAVTGLPVRMGERVVAVVLLTTHGAGALPLDEARSAVARAGPRLASALLFDDVRRLATVDERMRMAREIHDGIAQDVASLGYLVDDIAHDADAGIAARLAVLRENLASMVGDLRMSIFDLRAGVDDAVSLARALADYAQRVGHQAGLALHFSADESPQRLPVAVEIELLRMVQEAVTNVRRHAQATNLWVSIVTDPPRAHLTVLDDGLGLQTPRADSMGLTGMRERARRIGADLQVRTRDDGPGTRVDIRLDGERVPLSGTPADTLAELDLRSSMSAHPPAMTMADSDTQSRRVSSVRDVVGLARSPVRRVKDRPPATGR